MASDHPRDPRDAEIEGLRREVEELKRLLSASSTTVFPGEMNPSEAWQALVEAVPGVFFVALDPECTRVMCSTRTRELLQLKPEQSPSFSALVGERPTHCRAVRDGEPLLAEELPLQRAAKGEVVINAEVELAFNDGRQLFLHGSATPIWGPDDRPIGAVAAYADVTTQKIADIEFRRSTARLQAALAASQSGTWELEGELARVTLSPWLADAMGVSREPMLLDGFIALAHEEDRPEFERVLSEALTHRSSVAHEVRFVRADGTVRWVYIRGEIRTNFDDVSPTISGTLNDFTDLKTAAAALQASERRFRGVFELPLVAVIFWNLDGFVTDANLTACRILGYSRKEMQGGHLRLKDLTPPEYEQLDVVNLEKDRERGYSGAYEKECLRKDGTRVHVQVSAALLGPGEGGVVLFHDIEERVAQEQEREALVSRLDSERQRLSDMLARAPAAIAMFSGPDHRVVMVNEGMAQVLGEHPKLGLPVLECFPPMADRTFVDHLDQVYRTGKGLVGHEDPTCLHLVNPTNPREMYVDYVYEPIRDLDGKVNGVFLHAIDVTSRVIARRKVERLNEELEERVRIRTAEHEAAVREMAEFTYSVSHDLRAPLRAIMATSRILVDEIGPDLNGEDRELLERQAYNAQRLGVLIDELLKHSRLSRRPLKPEVVNLSVIADDIVRSMPIEPDRQPIRAEIQPNLVVIADAAHTRLLLESLLQNAWKFSPNGGTVTFAREGSAYFVRDQGIGFEMKYVHKLFQPFERLVLDRDFPGTGIGLANVRRIAEIHGGAVWAEGELGVGATFYFRLGPG